MTHLRAFTMPKWGIEMTEGTVSQWSIEPGQTFARGDVIAVIETEKINNDIEAEFQGILCRQLVAVGETRPVGALLAVLATGQVSADDIDVFVSNFSGGGAATHTTAAPLQADTRKAASVPSESADYSSTPMSPAARARVRSLGLDPTKLKGSGRNGRLTLQDVIKSSRPPREAVLRAPVTTTTPTFAEDASYASPRAARLISENGLDARTIEPTGPRGRISKADVLASLGLRDGAAAYLGASGSVPQVLRMSAMRKVIAQRLTQAKTQIPHFYLRMQVRVDALLELRERARMATGSAPSINDYLVRAAALSLRDVPAVNIQVHGDEIHQFPHADIAIAVATDAGLLTPIIFAADTKSVAALAAEIASLAQAARAGKLVAEQFKGGSFTVSNLGMHGIDEFDAIINPPQGAILAVGAVRRRPIEIAHALAFASIMQLTLSCDHRAIDGAVGSKFMSRLRDRLEEPASLTR